MLARATKLFRSLVGGKGGRTVLIYTMGKVGSTAMYETLLGELPGDYIFHVHFLSEFWLRSKLPSMAPGFQVNIREGERVLAHLQKYPHDRIKIITLIREPLARDLSDVFENWVHKYPGTDIGKMGSAQMGALLDAEEHGYTLGWFDSEFKNFTGLDIYSVPFPKRAGYSIISHGRFDVLCLKLEMLSVALKPAFKDFLGLRLEKILHRNTTLEKEGHALYGEMKKSYRPNPDKLASLYGSAFVRHFYDDNEIEGFIKQWCDEN